MSDLDDGSSSSSLDSDNEGDFGEETMQDTDQHKRVMDAVCKSCENPYDYNLHLAAIAELSGSPLFVSQLEQQFERFHQAFPLTLELWLQYIELNPEKLPSSFEDYLFPALYYKYVEDLDDDEEAEEKWTAVLRALGSHWSECENVYHLYRDFLKSSISDPTKLNARVRSSYQGQLASPYFEGSDRVLSEYRAWSQYQAKPGDFTNEQDSIKRRIQSASSLLAKMQGFERDLDRVDGADASALQALWFEYVKFAISRVNTLGCAIVLSVLERSVAAVCLSAELWGRYLAFLQDKGMSTLAVAKRAVRNVPFASAPWVALFVAMETEGEAADAIHRVGEDLCQRQPCPLEHDNLLEVLLAYCDAVRRTASKKHLRAAFNACKAAVGEWTLGRCCLLMYESKCTIDDTKTGLNPRWVEIWDEILTHRGHELTVWQTCIAECLRLGGKVAEARAYYVRGVAQVTDYPAALAEAWVLFEREMGDHVRFWVVAKAHYDKLVRELHASYYAAASEVPQSTSKPTKKRPADGPAVADAPKPAQDPAKKAAKQVEYKKQRLLDDTNHKTVFLCELDKAVTKDDLVTLFTPCGPVVDVRMLLRNRESQASRGMAYVEFETEAGVENALKLDKQPFHGNPLNIKISKPTAPKQPVVKDGVWKTTSSTIYVTGFGDTSTEESLQNEFTKYGQVKAVMILGRKQKKNIYALVEFTDTENVDTILAAVAEANGLVAGASVHVKRARFSVADMQEQQAKTKATQKPHAAAAKTKPEQVQKPEPAKKPAPKAKPAETHEHGQKPRIALSLVPRSLKASKDGPKVALASQMKEVVVKEGSKGDVAKPATSSMKSNDDFRKLYSSK